MQFQFSSWRLGLTIDPDLTQTISRREVLVTCDAKCVNVVPRCLVMHLDLAVGVEAQVTWGADVRVIPPMRDPLETRFEIFITGFAISPFVSLIRAQMLL